MRPEPGTILCRMEDVPAGGKGFEFGEDVDVWRLFLVASGGDVHAYENSCPHQGTPLNMLPDRFLTLDEDRILCTTHGAQFRIEDGFCTRGPCEGRSLSRIAIELVDGVVRVAG